MNVMKKISSLFLMVPTHKNLTNVGLWIFEFRKAKNVKSESRVYGMGGGLDRMGQIQEFGLETVYLW